MEEIDPVLLGSETGHHLLSSLNSYQGDEKNFHHVSKHTCSQLSIKYMNCLNIRDSPLC
jgi:hypothetical protein